jgi:DNA-binding NtrC family response regulator
MRQTVILLVEDESPIRELAAFVLQQANFVVLPACDASEALWITRSHAEIDLLLTDVQMTGMDGIELAKEVLRESPGTKALIMSGFADSLISASEEGFPVLLKPFTPTTLIEQVQHVLMMKIPAQSESGARQSSMAG